jgi:hypothetical protein
MRPATFFLHSSWNGHRSTHPSNCLKGHSIGSLREQPYITNGAAPGDPGRPSPRGTEFGLSSVWFGKAPS